MKAYIGLEFLAMDSICSVVHPYMASAQLVIGPTCAMNEHMPLAQSAGQWLSCFTITSTYVVQVSIPEPLRSGIVVLSCIDFAICLSWERMLRHAFPAKIPPQKGYMAFQAQTADCPASGHKKTH